MKKNLFTIIFLLIVCSLTAQIEHKNVKERMWANQTYTLSKPDSIPERWKDESAVILFQSIDFEYGKRRSAAIMNYDIYFRRKVLLRDKSAVKSLSEFSFKGLGVKSFKRDSLFMGIRIIKPDGTIKEIDTKDAVSIEMQQDATSSETEVLYKKLAIPDLEIGDVIDYYFVSLQSTYTNTTGFSNYLVFDPDYLILTEEYPIIQGKVSFVAERKTYLKIACLNGAPELVTTKNPKNIINELAYFYLDKKTDEPWVFPYLTEPLVKFQFIFNSGNISTAEEHFLGEPEVPQTKMEESNYISLLDECIAVEEPVPQLFRKGTSFIQKVNRAGKTPTAYDLFFFIRNYLYFNYFNYYGQNIPMRYKFSEYEIISIYSNLLKSINVPHAVFLATNQSVTRLENALFRQEFRPGIRIQDGDKQVHMLVPGRNSLPGDQSYLFQDSKLVVKKIHPYRTNTFFYDSLTEMDYNSNKQVQTISVNFTNSDLNQLNCKLSNCATGVWRNYFTDFILNQTDYWDEEWQKLNEIVPVSSSIMTKSYKNRKPIFVNKENTDKKREEILTDWLKESYLLNNLSLQHFKIEKTGRFDAKEGIVFNCIFTTSDLLGSAGEYIVMDVGKLLGKNLEVDKNQRERIQDIFMSFPRSFQWNIDLKVPAGYQIEDISNLDMEIETAAGIFRSHSVVTNNILQITVEKNYVSGFYPRAEWPELLKLLDAANQFEAQKIVLTKIAEDKSPPQIIIDQNRLKPE